MIPYQREDRDIYDGLEFDPGELELWPDNMFQQPALLEAIYLLSDHFVGSTGRQDVLVTGAAFICYDRSNLNVRIGPDCMVAIGVDALAIRERRLYLPWEAGKPPDFVLEWASDSTAGNDIGPKREIYQSIGVGEYWRFDSTGGRHYGVPMIGERLVNGRYEPFDVVAQVDGSVKGYSPTLDLYFTWEPLESGDELVCVHDPATGQRMQPYSEVKARADAAEVEVRELKEQLRRLRGD